jgi:hypothetical protein
MLPAFALEQRRSQGTEPDCGEGELHLRPAPQQVMVDPCQLDSRRISWSVYRKALNRSVEIIEKGSVSIAANHALHPEERRDTCASCHGSDPMETRRRIEHHMPGGQLY